MAVLRSFKKYPKTDRREVIFELEKPGQFIFLFRKIQDSQVWNLSPSHFKVFVSILLNVNWKPTKQKISGEYRKINPGQMVTSQGHISELAGESISRSAVRRALDNLNGLDIIELESTNQGTILTVKNWDKYQHIPRLTNRPANRPSNQAESEGSIAGNEPEQKNLDSRTDQRTDHALISNKVNNKVHKPINNNEPNGSEKSGELSTKSEELSTKDKQGIIVDVVEDLDKPDSWKWKFAGHFLKYHPFTRVKKAVRDLMANGKLQTLAEEDDKRAIFKYLSRVLSEREDEEDDGESLDDVPGPEYLHEAASSKREANDILSEFMGDVIPKTHTGGYDSYVVYQFKQGNYFKPVFTLEQRLFDEKIKPALKRKNII